MRRLIDTTELREAGYSDAAEHIEQEAIREAEAQRVGVPPIRNKIRETLPDTVIVQRADGSRVSSHEVH